MSHHFLLIALLTTRFTLPKIYSAWLFPSGGGGEGGGDLRFYTERLRPQVKSLRPGFHEPDVLSNLGRPSLFRSPELIQTPILIPCSRTKFRMRKMLILPKLLPAKYVIIIYALCSVHVKLGVRIRTVQKSFHSRNSRPG